MSWDESLRSQVLADFRDVQRRRGALTPDERPSPPRLQVPVREAIAVKRRIVTRRTP